MNSRQLTTTQSSERGAWKYVAVAMFVVAWGGNEFTPLLVMYRHQGFDPVTVNLLLFCYVLGIVPGLLIAGPLSDRLGRRPIMLFAPLIGILGSVVIACSQDLAAGMAVGRVLSGFSVGIAMTVGGSWVKELSSQRFDPDVDAGAGARRAAMSLTAGFGLGALAAGLLAQFSSSPGVFPYVAHILVSIPILLVLTKVPETRQGGLSTPQRGSLWDDLKIPDAFHRRFLYVILPVAPWVFGAGGVAYAILPNLMEKNVGSYGVLSASLFCLVALTAGFVMQGLGRKIDTPKNARGAATAMVFVVVGMILAAVASSISDIYFSLFTAIVLGCGYGMALVCGLQEVQRIAQPQDLAGLTSLFYCFTYIGFAFPAILTQFQRSVPEVSYAHMLLFGAAVALLFLISIVINWSRNLPAPPSGSSTPMVPSASLTRLTAYDHPHEG